MNDFYQTPPTLDNQYENDDLIKLYLKKALPNEMLREIEPTLIRLGERAIKEILTLGKLAEAQPPHHVPYDAWGKRIDLIETSDAWKNLERISAEEELVSIAYQRKHGEFSRIHQFARVYLFGPSSAIFTCPLAMTDGAARAIELYGDSNLKETAFKHLTSKDPNHFWTSGQWMTERTGGSDVSGTQTIAKPDGSRFQLFGTKWFTSATTSQMAITLARIEGAPEGNSGLSMFYLALKNSDGTSNGIQVHRLKDKLGTKALPTAELTLNGAKAVLMGGEGDGVKKISSLFNITRIWNACCAVGYMRRGIALVSDYSRKRKAFGKLLIQHGLHQETIHELQTEFCGAFLLTFKTAELLGKDETQVASKNEATLLRLLTPLAKLYTAKQAVSVSSEVLECFGGAGYVEDTGIPQLLRDCQVLPIWEGTTNVLCLDVIRVLTKENASNPLIEDLSQRIKQVQAKELQSYKTKLQTSLQDLEACLGQIKTKDSELVRTYSRKLSFSIARIYTASLILDFADWVIRTENDTRFVKTVARWCGKDLSPPIELMD